VKYLCREKFVCNKAGFFGGLQTERSLLCMKKLITDVDKIQFFNIFTGNNFFSSYTPKRLSARSIFINI
jgi:hypothetical protein